MIRLGNTTFEDSVKKLSFSVFKKMHESNPDFMRDIRGLGLDLETAYTQVTGHVPKSNQTDSKSKPGATDKRNPKK